MPGGLPGLMLQIAQFEVIFIVQSLNPIAMKPLRYLFILLASVTLFSSCSVWNRVFPPKYGCESDGKNVGAEKLLDGNHKKPPKFKA